MACINSINKVVDYLHDDDIVEFFCLINPNFTLEQIPDYIRESSAEWLALKTGTVWQECNNTFLLSGDRSSCIQTPRVPIVELTKITVTSKYDETTELILTGSSKQIEFACDTGIIRLIRPIHLDDTNFQLNTACIDFDLQSDLIFPEGLNNICVEGVFGNKPLSILKLLQLLNMAKTMQLLQPEKYAFGKISEQIGRYKYSLGVSTGDNKVLSFDGYIQMLCDLLPKESSCYIGTI